MREVPSEGLAYRPAAYAPAVVHGDFVFVAGQTGRDIVSGDIVARDFESEVALTLENAKAVLQAAGSSLANVCMVTVYLSDPSLFQAFDKIYREYFAMSPRPARTAVAVELLRPDIRIEIDLIAVVAASADAASRDRGGHDLL